MILFQLSFPFMSIPFSVFSVFTAFNLLTGFAFDENHKFPNLTIRLNPTI